MRIIEVEKKSDGSVYLTKLSYSEIEMMWGLLKEAHKKTPKIFEMSPARNRMKDMIAKMEEVIRGHRMTNEGYQPWLYVSKKRWLSTGVVGKVLRSFRRILRSNENRAYDRRSVRNGVL